MWPSVETLVIRLRVSVPAGNRHRVPVLCPKVVLSIGRPQ